MKKQFNYSRKIWHLLGIIVPLSYYLDLFHNFAGFNISSRIFLTILMIFNLILVILVDYFRLTNKKFADFFWQYFGGLMKQDEKNKINATVPYLLSNIFVIYFFPPEISILAILFLIIGDPFAAYVGVFYGKKKLYNGKSLEGLLAFFISSMGAGTLTVWLITYSGTFLGVSQNEILHSGILFILLLGASSAALAELFSKNTLNGLIDDNFNIPFFSSIVMGLFAIFILGLEPSEIFLY